MKEYTSVDFDKYPVQFKIEKQEPYCQGDLLVDEPQTYFFMWLPDFGPVACSARGDTLEEAYNTLFDVFFMVVDYYQRRKKSIPAPTVIQEI
ncbi:MAG: hypothetical protein KAS32_25380 [Candidatus Peribacteraceae bacterium]|nr:hypothetical protein [Candidatus Peribacteraceae bacterium]